MHDSVTMKLRKPVVIGGETWNELTLREPTAGELARATRSDPKTGVEPSGVDVSLTLLHLVSEVPFRVIESLCQRDFQEAVGFLERFGNDLPTG